MAALFDGSARQHSCFWHRKSRRQGLSDVFLLVREALRCCIQDYDTRAIVAYEEDKYGLKLRWTGKGMLSRYDKVVELFTLEGFTLTGMFVNRATSLLS